MEKQPGDFAGVSYSPAQSEDWQGRQTPSALGIQYRYQQIQLLDLQAPLGTELDKGVMLLSYACEAGVKRNQGRLGAGRGPAQIRRAMASLAADSSLPLYDLGTWTCNEDAMEGCQEALASGIGQVIQGGHLPLVLGGGHDVAFASYQGLGPSLGRKRLGIINFDAHFDLREPLPAGHSGSPFRQIADAEAARGSRFQYAVLGLQPASNPPMLFETAHKLGVQHMSWEAYQAQNWQAIQHWLDAFLETVDGLYISLDLDGFSAAYAPGVSAPSPLGFSPELVFRTLRYLFAARPVWLCDIAEMNPRFDQDSHTARLAARCADQMLRLWAAYSS